MLSYEFFAEEWAKYRSHIAGAAFVGIEVLARPTRWQKLISSTAVTLRALCSLIILDSQRCEGALRESHSKILDSRLGIKPFWQPSGNHIVS